MRGKPAAPLVRVAANQPHLICFALDAGARGIVVPMVNTSAEAEAVVRACRYFPSGNRSNAGERGEWGEFKTYRNYMDAVNNELRYRSDDRDEPVAGEPRCHCLGPGR
jgi:2-keto-3-deoxy-L-rhamnonate aldolase RhmA